MRCALVSPSDAKPSRLAPSRTPSFLANSCSEAIMEPSWTVLDREEVVGSKPIGPTIGIPLRLQRSRGILLLGNGRNWEEALANAENRIWRIAHPFNLYSRNFVETLFLRAQCDRCNIVSEHRVKLRFQPTRSDWEHRAEQAETALLRKLKTDCRWLRCGHLSGEIRLEQQDLLGTIRS